MDPPEDQQQSWPATDELQALGSVIQAASMFENALAEAFCALIGSKYASVLIGSMTSKQLIDNCRALTSILRELSEVAKVDIGAALNHCSEANSKRNRLVHDMWAFGLGGITHQLRRERAGYDLASRPVTLAEINATANELTTASVELHSVLLDNLGPERLGLEAQLRWEDAVSQMTLDDQTKLMHGRLAGLLGEKSRLVGRYHEDAWSSWAIDTATVVKSDPAEGLRIISNVYSQEDISSLTLSGEPSDSGPAWLRTYDPNAQLSIVREQIWQLTSHLLSRTPDGDSSPSSD